VVFRGTTASLQWEQNLSQNWTLRVQHQRQNLKNDDRIAFPFGCFDAARDTYYADRYCPDGSADLYDFRSDNERRNTQATQIKLNGNTQWGAWQHRISAQAMRSSHKARFQDQAYNAVGTVNIYAPRSVAADPTLTDVNTNRDESSREFALTDAANIGNFTAWLGVRHTQLNRSSVRTDGSRPLRYEQNITTPWLAASYQFTPELMAYASFGQGAETDAAPNRARYTNRGQVLATLKSQQSEFGVKHASTSTQWSMALFRIKRPVAADIGTCSGTADCTRQFDGSQDHTGVELTWAQRLNSQWQARTSASFIHAKRSGSAQTGINGLSPTNVPRYVLLAGADWQIKSGLKATVDFSAQGERFVLPDNSLKLPAWQRVDVRVEHRHRLGGQTLNWTAGIDNLLDQRRFQESPYQFGHSYLFTAAPRSLRLNMALAW
jgi:iron complex outermembrane receptor protein